MNIVKTYFLIPLYNSIVEISALKYVPLVGIRETGQSLM